MASIKILRNSEFVFGKRNFNIILTDISIGKIGSGETLNIPIQPGEHELYLKVDWCRSKKRTFTIEEGEQVQFRCYYGGDPFSLFWDSIINFNDLLTLETVDELHDAY